MSCDRELSESEDAKSAHFSTGLGPVVHKSSPSPGVMTAEGSTPSMVPELTASPREKVLDGPDTGSCLTPKQLASVLCW